MAPERISVSHQVVISSEKGKEPVRFKCFTIKWGRGLQNEIDVSFEDGGRQTVLWVVRGAKVRTANTDYVYVGRDVRRPFPLLPQVAFDQFTSLLQLS